MGKLLAAIALVVVACAPPRASEAVHHVAPETDSAIGYVLGSIWADGWVDKHGHGAVFLAGTGQIADSVQNAARSVGWRAERSGNKVTFPGLSDADVHYHGAMTQGSKARLIGFLVGVIQGEGGRGNGLVLDDPYADRAHAMSVMLDRLGIAHRVVGRSFFHVFVMPSEWRVFADWPFVTWARVPGGPPGLSVQVAGS